jgi:GDP-L-fucose synthase
MHNFSDYGFVNIGTGEDLAIIDLARTIKDIVGYEGEIVHDFTKPDGTPRKLMSVDKLHAMGWKHEISLRAGIEKVYASLSDAPWF